MMINFPRQRFGSLISKHQGFTLIEVMVAGGVLLLVMTGIARISIQSITSGRHRIERDKIESTIHDNIQLIQQADSRLTLEAIPKNQQRTACLNPALYLKEELEKEGGSIGVSPPKLTGVDGKNPITRTIKLGDQPGITLVIYEFSAPEYSIKKERRVVELNPNFQTRCILE